MAQKNLQAQGLDECVTNTNCACPGCGSAGLVEFYRQQNIPANSCLLMSSREQALACARGNMELALCQACGLISNTAFDQGTQDFSKGYEGTQSFSACFNDFARSMAQRLIDEYGIHGKRILEIGCGNGEFLSLMCELGGNEGVGFDPAYAGQDPAGRQLTFVKDYYCDDCSDIQADVVCCRHTLEHVGDVRGFLDTVRRGIGDKRDVVVFFEVPNGERVINEGAFWDIYYEHCNYFTAEALKVLFERAGFIIDRIRTEYDGQYLILTARPADSAANSRANRTVAGEHLDSFVNRAAQRVLGWNDFFLQAYNMGQRVLAWGSSSNCVSFLSTVDTQGIIEHVVDINPRKTGMYMPATGQRIMGPESVAAYKPDKIIIINPVYVSEIAGELRRQGVRAELVPITAI
jgi:SAM-dependent methyltransferase